VRKVPGVDRAELPGGGGGVSALYPTKTRRALLRDVADGLIVAEGAEVYRDERLAGFYDPLTAERTKVTARIREMEGTVGWVAVFSDRVYRLTDAGRAVLDAAGVSA
jgi:hypothetical protein